MRNSLIVILLFLIGISANAQSHNEQVTVEGTYAPQIQKSERITKTPDITENDFNIPNYEINTEDYIYNYNIDLEPVSPLTYTQKNDYVTTNNFLKAGLGTRVSPDFLFRHYSNPTKRMSLGIGVTHNSTWLGMKNYENAKYMNNEFRLSMTNRFSQLQLHSYVNYHYDMYFLNNDTDANARKIHSLNAGVNANNNKSSYMSLYDEFALDYSYSGIQGGMQENLLKFNAHLEHTNSWFRSKDNMQTLSLDLNAELDNIEQTLFIIAANPHLAFDGEFYNLHLGFRVDAKTNSTSVGGIYPDIKGSLYLFERNFEFYAGLGGKTKINSLKEILSENPFIISDLTKIAEFDYEKTKLDFQGGLRFNIMNAISANIGIRYRNIDNMIFYVPSFENPGTFDIELSYCIVFNILADINFRLNDKINATANFAYNNYSRELYYFTHNWYKPKVEFMLKGFYKYNDKWDFNIATYFEGVRYAQSFDGNIEKLKPICDIQLGCDYNFRDDLSFYAEVKNLIHNKYQIYYGYPSYGFQMFLGFKYRF
ncbi:MAG: hypothetical protein IJA42_07360 [Bacteroidales bacterium]|nr:hypothetical protein [Bacteroidales bacterium]